MNSSKHVLGVLPRYYTEIFLVYFMYMMFSWLVLSKKNHFYGLFLAAMACFSLVYILRNILFDNRSCKAMPLFYAAGVMLSILVSITFQLALEVDVHGFDGRSAQRYIIEVFLFGIFWFLIGAFIQNCSIHMSSFKAVIVVFSVLCMVLASRSNGFVVDYLSIRHNSGVDSFSHLTIGLPAVFAIGYALSTSSGWNRIAVIIVAMIVLLMLGGRSLLAAFFVAIILKGFVLGRISLILGLAFGGVLVSFTLLPIIAENNAKFSFLVGDGPLDDASYVARANMLKESFGFEMLAYGAPQTIVHRFGSMGAYAHNFISIVQFYGVVPFIFFAISTVYSFRTAIASLRSESRPVDNFGFFLLALSVAELLFTKSISYGIYWFSLGFWLARSARIHQGAGRRYDIR